MAANTEVLDLTIVERDGKAMVFDLDLARVLQLRRPREIRSLIKRSLKTGFLNDSDICCVVQQNTGKRGRPAVAFTLTKIGALLITTRSDSEVAHVVTRGIVTVFDDHDRKHLPANDNAHAHVISVPVADLEEMRRALTKLQSDVALLTTGHISPQDWNRLRAEVKRIATLEYVAGKHVSVRAGISAIYHDIGQVAQWGGRGRSWKFLPAKDVHAAFATLRIRDQAVNKMMLLAADSKQTELPFADPDAPKPPPKPTKH